jgi:hypothetical protein
LTVALIAGTIFALKVPFNPLLTTAILGSVTFVFVNELSAGQGTAWVGFVLARPWLALRRGLPWRLMRFLEDAHQRGILRQAGAVYQFRHGKLQDYLALSDLHDTLAHRRELLGEDHPDTLMSADTLAAELYELGEYAQSQQLFEDIYARRRRTLGEDHPDTLAARHDLATLRAEAGDPAGAVDAFQLLLDDYVRVLGKDHPDTLATRTALVDWRSEVNHEAGRTDNS